MTKKSLNVVPKRASNNSATREIEFLISSDAKDRDGDTINPGGWVLDNYLKNPIVLWGHDRRSAESVIGKATSISVGTDGLRATAQFATAEENPLADTVYRLLQGGYLNAVSVGFNPIEYKYRDAPGDYGVDFIKQELLEFSVVSIPCNPEALTTARAKGLDLSAMVEPLRAMASEGPEDMRPRYTAAYLAASGLDAVVPKQVHDAGGVLMGEIVNGVLRVNPNYQKELAARNADALKRVAFDLRQKTETRRRRLQLTA